MHRGHERDERDKQRAKNEVNRLNGVVSGTPTSGVAVEGGAPWRRKPAISPVNNDLRQATPADRKRQLAQLGEMGVAIPEEFRKEMAMVGDWQVLSERPVFETVKMENGTEDRKPDGLNIGVRKRKYEGQEEEEEAGETVVRKGWGSTTRAYPDADQQDDDLDTLLGKTLPGSSIGRDGRANLESHEKGSKESSINQGYQNEPISQQRLDMPVIKSENLEESEQSSPAVPDDRNVKQEESPPETGILFKKRKSKSIRTK